MNKAENKMDAKITKKRLARLLSYDWIKIVALAIVAILVWYLIFTMTATRITPAQQFTVFNYRCNRTLTDTYYDSFDSALSGKNKIFSYEVIEGTTNDLTTAGEYASTLLEARTATEEGDVILIPNIPDGATATVDEATGETSYRYSYIETFLFSYFPHIYELKGENGYFAQLEKLLNEYYKGDYTNENNLDTEKVERVFLNRAEKNNDKRFKKQAKIEQGIRDEIERIKKYRAAYIEFNEYLTSGLVEFTDVKIVYGEGENDYREGAYALNICPDETKAEKLKDFFSYTTVEKDSNDEDVYKATAQDMNVLFFDFDGVEESFQYESLLYVNYLIRSSVIIKGA